MYLEKKDTNKKHKNKFPERQQKNKSSLQTNKNLFNRKKGIQWCV
jgi:hypothetical protein